MIAFAAQFSFDETLRAVRDVERAVEYVRAQTPAVVNVGPAIADSAPRGGGVITQEQGGHPSDEHWYAIGRCEQPGNGLGGVAWDTHSSTYEGGLGFALSTWATYRHEDMPLSAGDATPAQQIAVANDLWALHGASPWGCKSDVP